MSQGTPINVVLIEDEKEVRQGLSYILDNTEGFKCLGSYRTFEDAFASMTKAPDVLLSDIGLPGMSGVEGVRRFKEKFPTASIVMLTVYRDDDKIFESILSGATGYILKKASPSAILEAIRDVSGGGAPMSPEIAMKVLEAFRSLSPKKGEDTGLTRREEEILQELVTGNAYKTIADHLNISLHTVRFHIRSIYEKLQVHSKSEAVSKALRQNIVR